LIISSQNLDTIKFLSLICSKNLTSMLRSFDEKTIII